MHMRSKPVTVAWVWLDAHEQVEDIADDPDFRSSR